MIYTIFMWLDKGEVGIRCVATTQGHIKDELDQDRVISVSSQTSLGFYQSYIMYLISYNIDQSNM